jgi:hypothetical protein
MSRQILFIVGLFFLVHLFAQTGIGTTTPNASAKLDVYSTNKGFLPPRVSLTDAYDVTTIPSPATGLLIYCKGDAGLAAGYYFFNGTAWATIATAGGSGSFASSYLRGSRSTTQSIAVGGIVTFSNIDNSAGADISLNTSTGKITLAPGNTYRLRGAVPNFSGGQRPAFVWYNETTTSNIGSATYAYNPGDAAAYGAFGAPAESIITPTVSTVLSFRLLSSLSSGNVTAGGNIDFTTAGSYPWFDIQVISGNAPVTGQSVDYVSVGSINLTGVGGNQDLIFSSNFGGNIPYNSTTGFFTLSANKTYLFQTQVRVNTASANGNYIEYGFVDGISNTLLVNGTETITSSTTSTAGYGSNPVINFVYTPISNQTVKLRTTSGTRGTQSVVSGTANITQIGSSAIINPWTLSGTNSYNTLGNVGIGTSSPNTSAILDVSSSSKGILIPRMTASQKNAISSPTIGLLIFQTDAPTDFYYYNGSSWISLTEPNWTSAGTIQSVGWTATTTAPTIGTTAVNDYSYKQIGSKTWRCQLTYSAGSNSIGANNGTGDYVFTLPNGLQFNTTLAGQNATTDNVGSSNWTWPGLWLSSSSGSITNLNQGGHLFVVPFSSTQYRLIHAGIAGVGYVIPYASGYYGVGSNISWRVTFTFQSL